MIPCAAGLRSRVTVMSSIRCGKPERITDKVNYEWVRYGTHLAEENYAARILRGIYEYALAGEIQHGRDTRHISFGDFSKPWSPTGQPAHKSIAELVCRPVVKRSDAEPLPQPGGRHPELEPPIGCSKVDPLPLHTIADLQPEG